MNSSPQNLRSKMSCEVEEIPDALERLLKGSNGAIFKTAQALQKLDPCIVTTIARGSSDHAATYLKYAIELIANIPVASIGPSIASIYNTSLKLDNSASISISQ